MKAMWQGVGVGRAWRWALLVSLATGVPVSITRAVLAAPSEAVAEDATVEPPEFTAFLRWLGAYQDAATAEERAPLEPEGLRLSRDRRAAIAALIESAPDQALRLALPAAERAALPAAVAAEVEAHVSGRGRFEVTAFLPAPGPGRPPPTIERRLVTAGRSYRAYGLNRWRKLPHTERVAFHGIALGDAVALADRPVRRLATRELPNPALPPGNPDGLCPVCGCAARPDIAAEYAGQVLHFAEPDHVVVFSDVVERREPGLHASLLATRSVPARGPLRVLLVRTVFADQRGEAPISESDARTLGRQVEQFFADTSHGALALSLHISPLAVVGPSATYPAGMETAQRTDALAAVARAGVEPADYDLDVIYSKSPWGRSQAYIGSRGAWVSVRDATPAWYPAATVIHELGHNLGLHHARDWRTRDHSILGEGAAVDYGNLFDTMGSGGEFREPFNAYGQCSLGWLPQENLVIATNMGLFRLLPVDAQELVPGGRYALQLLMPGRTYWIETRKARPGTLLMHAVFPGHDGDRPVLLNTWPTRPGNGGIFNAPLLVGRSLLDSDASLRITPRQPAAGAEPDALDVEVRSVHHGFHEADAGVSNDARVAELEEATEGRAVHLAGLGEPWSVPVSVPAAGRYHVWLRVKSAPGELALRVAPPAGATFKAAAPMGPGWQWILLQEPADGTATHRRPALVTLPAGDSEIVFEATTEAWLDLAMLTDDSSPNSPPYLAPLPPVRLPGDGSTALVRPFATDVETGLVTKFFVHSMNTGLVLNDGLEWCTNCAGPELRITAVPGTLGRTTLRLSAVDGDGNGVSRSLSVWILGPIQSLVEAAGPGGRVRLPAGEFRDRLELATDMTLEGGLAGTVLDARGAGPAIRVAAGARVTLRDLTLRNGNGGIINEGDLILERVTISGMSGTGLDNFGTLFMRESTIAGNRANDTGAGLRNRGPGDARIENSTFYGNRTTAGNGGGIANESTLRLIQSTLSSNFAAPEDEKDDEEEERSGKGGGLYNSGNATLIACTIVNNQALHRGGGLHNAPHGSVVSLYSTILAGNSSRRGAGADGSGEIQSAGFNLLGDTADLVLVGDLRGNLVGRPAGLGPLTDNGGPTRTHPPLPDSPAVDAGAGADATHDQRGIFRRVDVAGLADAADGTDIGAVEFTPGAPMRVAPAAALDVASGVAALTLAVRADEAVSGLAFTLHYPPALLRNPEVLAGPDAAGAALELDPGVSLPGRLGVRVRFPADRPATPAGRRVLNVVFEAIRELHDPAQLRFEFGDEIAPRSAADAGGNAVSALFPPFVEAIAAAPPVLAVHPQAGGRVAVSLTALPGTRHELEATADFENWEPIGTMNAADGVAVLDDPGATAQAHRFYRWRR